MANYEKCQEDSSSPDYVIEEKLARDGSCPKGVSPYGVHNMAGNVWEWVSDYYSSTYYSWSPYENPQGHTENEANIFIWLACPTCIYYEHALRGGYYGYGAEYLTTADQFIQM